MNDHDADLELALDATRRAGRLVMRWFGHNPEVYHKAPDQPVTPADLAADELLRKTLLAARPTYGWLSEETADDPRRLGRSRVWIVDPIDGTRSFIAGRPEFAISVGLAENGEAVVGVVMNPATDEVYWAVRGGSAWGATGSGTSRTLSVSINAQAEATLLASRSDIRHGEIAPVLEHLPDRWRLEGLGSTAYKMARIAAGHGDAFLSRGPRSEWDVCAGGLLVELAGGRSTDLEGRPFRFNRRRTGRRGVLASTGRDHDRLLDAVTAAAK